MVSMPSLPSRALAEFVGTMTLIAAGVGAIFVTGLDPNHATSASASLVAVALAHGLAIAIMVTAVGHVSGGHLNPAVTFAMFVTRQIKALDAAVYGVAQIAGGVAGALLIKTIFPSSIVVASNAIPSLNPAMSTGGGIVLEMLMTFFLVWVVFGVAVDRDGAFFKVAGLPIGFAVLMDILFGGPLTGAAMNPARALGPAIAFNDFNDWWIYWVGGLGGAVIAGLVYMYGIKPRLETA